MTSYNHHIFEKKWREVWKKSKLFSPNLAKDGNPFYNLMMFPYPSAEGLHVGNMYAFTGSDIYGRMKRMQGNDVFEPIGLDGFGIHSENYAIKVNKNPKEQAKISQKNFYRQLEATGNAFDWERTLETYDPSYYEWTQWIFIQLFKKGLAYRSKSPVNFCPSCKTVLADEQVVQKSAWGPVSSFPPTSARSKLKLDGDQNENVELRAVGNPSTAATPHKIGICERCSTPVVKKNLEQWFFRITKYADRLLKGLDKIDWSDRVKIAQKNWIGRKEGARIRFEIEGRKRKFIEVFTTRADTLYGATFIVLAPELELALEIATSGKKNAIKRYQSVSFKRTELERQEAKVKSGIFTGSYAINPINGSKIPIWVADYALADYGTGALFGDAHDERDVEFAKKFNIPLKPTVITSDNKKNKKILNLQECFTGEGILVNSGEFTGLTSEKAKKKVVSKLIEINKGDEEITYHLRDWLISRQRYWGPPIPVIYCVNCWRNKKHKGMDYVVIDGKEHAIIPVPEKDLPVKLPDVKDWRPTGTGKSPLASVESFVKVACPECGSSARRETDVSDTFLDSAWYFLRYSSTDDSKRPWTPEIIKKWLPVDMYIGGAEHSVLHLLYTRFLTMVFKDLGLIGFEEPFIKFRAHGLLISEGAKMSKSKGNIVNPDDYIHKYGADTLRCYLMFCGRYQQGGDFQDKGIEGMKRFLNRVWKLVSGQVGKWDSRSKIEPTNPPSNKPTDLTLMHKTIKQVTEDIESLDYNTAISALMIWLRALEKRSVDGSQLTVYGKSKKSVKGTLPFDKSELITMGELETFLKLLAPFAPFISEELWQEIKGTKVANRRKASKGAKISSDTFNSIHLQPWPKFDLKLTKADEIQLVVQVNGKVRDTVSANWGISQNEAERLALASEKVQKYIEGKKHKIIFVKDKLINLVMN